MTNAHKVQDRLYEIRPPGPARRLATQKVREQPYKKINLAVQIAARHNFFSQMASIYVMNCFIGMQVGIDPRFSHLGGEIVSHYTTDA